MMRWQMGMRAAFVAAVALGGVGLAREAAAQGATPMELRTPDEIAVPGGVMQVKLEVTEPRPILTGGGGWSFSDYDQFLGLAIRSATGDAAAVGVMRGATLKVRMVSPTSGLGSVLDYPILTTTLRVPANAPLGRASVLDLHIDAFTGPGGVAIQSTSKPGVATVTAGASVWNVEPGSATVPAGGVIRITGNGFETGAGDTRVTLKGTPLSSVTVIDSGHIEIVPARNVTMHGAELQFDLRNSRQRFFYYSYQRSVPIPVSQDGLMRAVEPAFQDLTWTAAAVPFDAPGAGTRLGLSLQNPSAAPITVTLSLVNGVAPAGLSFPLPANARVSASLAEYFSGVTCASVCMVRVQASAPIQVLGLRGDVAADAVDPVLPVPDVPVTTALDFAPATNAASYRAGDLLVVTSTFTPGPAPVNADAYVVLLTPDGVYYSLTPGGVVPGIAPLFVNRAVSSAASVEVLRAALPPGLTFGAYQWLTVLTAPGTLQLLTPIRAAGFTVTP